MTSLSSDFQHWQCGLLGHGIAQSLTPGLQRFLGERMGGRLSYDLFDHEASFGPEILVFLERCAADGKTGINVTHPFKEVVCAHIELSPQVVAIGACNTIRFSADGRRVGFNTDCSGLQEALRPTLPSGGFGVVAQLGTGGFGKAAAFAVADLGVDELRLFDPVHDRALDLAERITQHTSTRPIVVRSVDELCDGASGIVNCSPIGMHHHPGNPVQPRHLDTAEWVFDAVYIPMETELLKLAAKRHVHVISGAELFFWQAIHAFQIFTGLTLEQSVIDEARAHVWPEVVRRAQAGE
jgi:shikimate dehydrogenase